MLKNTFLILAILFATNVVTYAQDTPAVNKSISFYMCGGSGNFNPDAGSMLNSWSEMGVMYSQNFAKAQWLTVTTTAAICTATGGFLTDPATGDAVGAQEENFDVTGYGKVNFSFGKYFALGVETSGRLDFDVKYKVALSANQSLTFRSYMEIHPSGKPLYAKYGDSAMSGIDPVTGAPNLANTRNVLNHLDFRIVYGVGFHPEWSFDSDMRFRFYGDSSGIGVKADSAEAMKNSFNIRWNNTINYSNANGFGGYFTFRYQPMNITVDVKHTIQVLAGISYAYDLSAL